MITKNYDPAKCLKAKMQTPQMDEYTEQIQRSHINETHQIRELKKKTYTKSSKHRIDRNIEFIVFTKRDAAATI